MSININSITNNLSHSDLKAFLLSGMSDVEFCFARNIATSQPEGLVVSVLAEYWDLSINSANDISSLRDMIEKSTSSLSRSGLRNLIDVAFFEGASRATIFQHYSGEVSARNGKIENKYSTLDSINPEKKRKSKIHIRIKNDEHASAKALAELSKIFGPSWKFYLSFYIDSDEDETAFTIDYRFRALKIVSGSWEPCGFFVSAEMPFSFKSLKKTYKENLSIRDDTDIYLQDFKCMLDVIESHLLKDKLTIDLKQKKEVKRILKI